MRVSRGMFAVFGATVFLSLVPCVAQGDPIRVTGGSGLLYSPAEPTAVFMSNDSGFLVGGDGFGLMLWSGGQVGETRMLLMAALLLADEHHDLVAKVAAGGAAARGSSEDAQKLHLKAEQAESQAADALESAAKKLEDIAARLAHA